MKILYLASGPVPSNAANSVHVVHMAGALASLGHDVTVLAPSSLFAVVKSGKAVAQRYGAADSFRLLNAWHPQVPGGSLLYRAILRVVLWVSSPDLVYSRHLRGACIAVDRGYGGVFEAHKPDWERSSRGRDRFWYLLGAANFLGVVCISEALAKHVVDSFPLASGRTFVAPDAGPNWPSSMAKPSRSSFVVGYFGSLLPGKGLETILSIAPHCPGATFLVVGGTRAEIAQIASSVDVPKNVILRVRQNHAVLPGLMARCDVLVAPYLEKVQTFGGGADVSAWMSPLKLFEYMSTGKPIICSDLPVLREVLEHDVSALLVSPGDTKRWVEAIDRLRNDEELQSRLATKALEDFRHNHTWVERARRTLAWVDASAT